MELTQIMMHDDPIVVFTISWYSFYNFSGCLFYMFPLPVMLSTLKLLCDYTRHIWYQTSIVSKKIVAIGFIDLFKQIYY